MIYLILSILVNASLILAFRFFSTLGINNRTAITFNYVTASLCGFLMTRRVPDFFEDSSMNWFMAILALGVLFIGLFNLIAFTTVHSGVSVAAVANKMSVVIPVVIATYMYNEQINILQAIGIVLAMLAVVFVSIKDEKKGTKKVDLSGMLAPIVLFVGCGLLDSLINYVQFRFVNETTTSPFLLSFGFLIAGCIGMPLWILQLIKNREPNTMRSIIAGLILGIPNFLSIWLMMKALESKVMNASSFFPVNNAGVVLVSSIMSAWLFSESFSKKNIVGIILALIAIILIAFF